VGDGGRGRDQGSCGRLSGVLGLGRSWELKDAREY
jgi:hypothetical protein